MSWAEVITESLPPRRGDEPGSLRADIADELADHLACAMKRELRRTDDEAAAERKVLEKFGNPATIARRLWWDAMKESIMKERITIGIMAGFLLLAAVAAAFTWQALREGREVNSAILARLEQLAKAPEPAKSAIPENWTKVLLRVAVEGGGPKPGLDVQLSGGAFSDNKDTLRATTDEQGVASFGPIRPGRYALWVGDSPDTTGTLTLSSLHTRKELTLYPGQSTEITLTYPAASYGEVSLRRAGELPKPDDMLMCSFEPLSGIKSGNDYWYATSGFQLLLKPDGGIVVPAGSFYIGKPSPEGLHIVCTERSQSGAGLRLPATKYWLKQLDLQRPIERSGRGDLCWAECGTLGLDRPAGAAQLLPFLAPPSPSRQDAAQPHLPGPEFSVTPGKNEWRIEVPAELLKVYQKILKQAAQPKPLQLPGMPVPAPGMPGAPLPGPAMQPPQAAPPTTRPG